MGFQTRVLAIQAATKMLGVQRRDAQLWEGLEALTIESDNPSVTGTTYPTGDCDQGEQGDGKTETETETEGAGVGIGGSERKSGGEFGVSSSKGRSTLRPASAKECEAFIDFQFSLFTGWPVSFYAQGMDSPSK